MGEVAQAVHLAGDELSIISARGGRLSQTCQRCLPRSTRPREGAGARWGRSGRRLSVVEWGAGARVVVVLTAPTDGGNAQHWARLRGTAFARRSSDSRHRRRRKAGVARVRGIKTEPAAVMDTGRDDSGAA